MLTSPIVVDFSVIDAEELARSCATRGGKVEAKSLERAVQQQRELTTLVTFYATASDIPSSPREPIDPYSGNKGEELVFGTPLDETRVSLTRSVINMGVPLMHTLCVASRSPVLCH